MYSSSVIAATLVFYAVSPHVYGVKVTGHLTFQDGAPEKIPDGSHLRVTLEDANMMDTGAKHLGHFTHKFKDHKPTDSIRYEIKDAKRPENGMSASLSAVLNVGWSPDDEKPDDWIRSGDFMNDVHHDVDVRSDVEDYEKDINVVQI